tara:strand:- start:474 stop:1244 length:771 start_codon:yes stop_codon:yes gene_type:complete
LKQLLQKDLEKFKSGDRQDIDIKELRKEGEEYGLYYLNTDNYKNYNNYQGLSRRQKQMIHQILVLGVELEQYITLEDEESFPTVSELRRKNFTIDDIIHLAHCENTKNFEDMYFTTCRNGYMDNSHLTHGVLSVNIPEMYHDNIHNSSDYPKGNFDGAYCKPERPTYIFSNEDLEIYEKEVQEHREKYSRKVWEVYSSKEFYEKSPYDRTGRKRTAQSFTCMDDIDINCLDYDNKFGFSIHTKPNTLYWFEPDDWT